MISTIAKNFVLYFIRNYRRPIEPEHKSQFDHYRKIVLENKLQKQILF